MPTTIRITYVDTCHPDYLTDHCTRPNEVLVGVEVTNDTTLGHVVTTLSGELANLDLTDAERFHDAPQPHLIPSARADLLTALNAFDAAAWRAPFAPHLPDLADPEDDRPSAWFRLSWEPTAARFEFQATGDETEIFRADDDACTPVVLIPFTGDGEEAAEAHQAFVRFVVAALNARAEAEGLT